MLAVKHRRSLFHAKRHTMRQKLQLKLLPQEAVDPAIIREHIARATGRRESEVSGFRPERRSIDARSRQPYILLSLEAFVGEPFVEKLPEQFTFPDVSAANRQVLIVGAGPAGLFAALRLI